MARSSVSHPSSIAYGDLVAGAATAVDVCDHLAAAVRRDLARRPVSPWFPVSSIADMKRANLESGSFWASREAMEDAGSRFHGAVRKSGLFIESIEWSPWGSSPSFRVHFMLPSGEVWTCVSLIESLGAARAVAVDVGAAMAEHEELQAVLSSVAVG